MIKHIFYIDVDLKDTIRSACARSGESLVELYVEECVRARRIRFAM